MMVKFYDLQKINAQYADELADAVRRVIDGGQYILGDDVVQFENQLAEFVGVRCAVGVGNGFDALRLIFRAYIELGVMKPGDEIIVSAHTFIATVQAITENHLKPVLVDPDALTYNLNVDPLLLEQYITDRTRGIVVVHLYGAPCWSEELTTLAQRYQLQIIEDNAQALGAMWGQRHTGALGHVAAHSFYPTKPLGALGDGGAVTTNDGGLASVVRCLANYGSTVKGFHVRQGVNSRLDVVQAAVLSVKMKYLHRELTAQRTVALYYLDNIKHPGVRLPQREYHSAWHLFVVCCKGRSDLREYLSLHGIQTMIHYPVPVHHQPAYHQWIELKLPVTERLSAEVLSLPLSSVLTMEEVCEVTETINQWEPSRIVL